MGSSKDDSPADSNNEALASNQGFFSEGERVLAYHGPLLYEAKVQKVENLDNQQRYYVHYLGWNKNWDEWVDMDRLMKLTEENVQKQQELEKNFSADKNPKSGRSAQTKPKSSNDTKVDKEDLRNYAAGRGKKRKGDYGVEEKDTGSTEKSMKIQFPSTLKKQLVDDREFVTQLGKLVRLPRNPNVDDILKKYLDYRSKKDSIKASRKAIRNLSFWRDAATPSYRGSNSKGWGSDMDPPWPTLGANVFSRVAESVGEILKGIRMYFDKTLPVMLLYKRERQQYHDAITDNVSPSTVYGAEHLLRLFVKMPELLSYVNMEEETLTQLQQKLHDFLKFLQKNQSAFFLSTYDSSKGLEETDEEQND